MDWFGYWAFGIGVEFMWLRGNRTILRKLGRGNQSHDQLIM
jgi:hypothetical protein